MTKDLVPRVIVLKSGLGLVVFYYKYSIEFVIIEAEGFLIIISVQQNGSMKFIYKL